jgi:ADP-ribose pyrophosphatase YjhB (NUDIX family)
VTLAPVPAADRLYPTRPFLAASIAVVRDGRVLIAARGRPPMERLYSLPGGLVEPGETLAEAALRELREEVGVEADLLGFVDHVEVVERDGEGRVRLHFVICAHAARWRAGEPRIGSEAQAVAWVREDEIANFRTTPGLAGVLRKAFALVEASSA